MSPVAPTYADDPRLAALIGPGGPLEVVETEIDGVPLRVFVRAPVTVVDSFRLGAMHADKVHLVLGDERWTFARVRHEALSLAAALRHEHGVGPGDRVAIAMRNLPEYYTAFWATVVLGAVVVPLNAWWTGPELAYGLADADARVAFCDAERIERLHTAATPPATTVVSVRTGPADGPTYTGLLATPPLDEADLPTLGSDDVVAILYTSGTTGRPKGALMTHRNLISNLMNMGFMSTRAQILAGTTAAPSTAQTCTMATGPLFHIGGVSGIVAGPMSGTKVVLLHRWDVDEAITVAIREQVTNLGGVPAVARQFLEHPDFDRLTHLRGVPMGGAAVPPDLHRKGIERFGGTVQLMNGYGLTETTAAVVHNVGVEYAAHPDSVGRPNLTADLRVEDSEGREVPTGEIGELCFRSPQVAKGYWNDPEATAAAFVDGWFHSGDLGYVDAEGFVYVVDRLKDVVIRGGENVYCAEVEAVLFEHRAVAEVAVVGVAEATLGERVCAVVVPRPGATVTLEELRTFAAARLAAFKLPEALLVTDQLPTTATAKVAKPALRAQVATATDLQRRW